MFCFVFLPPWIAGPRPLLLFFIISFLLSTIAFQIPGKLQASIKIKFSPNRRVLVLFLVRETLEAPLHDAAAILSFWFRIAALLYLVTCPIFFPPLFIIKSGDNYFLFSRYNTYWRISSSLLFPLPFSSKLLLFPNLLFLPHHIMVPSFCPHPVGFLVRGFL